MAARKAETYSLETYVIDLAELRATLDALAQQVRAAFVRYIGEIRP